MSPAGSPPPSGPLLLSNPTPVAKATTSTTNKEAKRGRGKIIGDIGEKEMKHNPKVSGFWATPARCEPDCLPQMQLPVSSTLSHVEWLTSRVDDLEAKLAYCGSKMDSLLSQSLPPLPLSLSCELVLVVVVCVCVCSVHGGRGDRVD